MSRRAQENLVAVALLVVFGGVLWLCQDFGPRARMIPLPLAIFGLVLTVIQIVWQNVRSTEELKMELISVSDSALAVAPAPEAAPKPPGTRDATSLLELRAYGLIALLIGLFLVVGLMPAVFIFTAGYFILTRQYSWLMGLIYTSAFTACVYVLFFAALQIEPYHGLLAPLADHFK
jgi:Tripartite tricarboxylate transporter TctB family